MCLVTRPKEKTDRVVRHEYGTYEAPRPVSNYHGGPAGRRSSRTTTTTRVRRSSASIPVERVSYRSYSREPARREADVTRVSRTNIGRSHSIRSKASGSDEKPASKHRFTMSSLRGMQQPELSKKLYKLIKTENHAIGAYETAGRESHSIATQLSDWGESTNDDAVSDLSDKLGVLLSEVAEQEDLFAQNLEDSRSVLKQIRNTESSVQPSRNHKQKVQDEIAKLKYKEPESTKLITLEQELVRAEAQSLVAEAQLTNITRQKFKEAYDLHTAAIIERAEKQIMLALQARQLVSMLDDTPIVPGEERPAFASAEPARQVLNNAEEQLRGWTPNFPPIHSNAGKMGSNAMPGMDSSSSPQMLNAPLTEHLSEGQRIEAMERAQEEASSAGPPYPTHETEASLA